MSIYDKASLVLIPSGTKTSKVYSQKPVNGDGDFIFSRSTAATRVNADGNIEKETQNLALQSNSFNNWTNYLTTETGGQADRSGGTSAWLLEKTGSGGSIYRTHSTSGVATFSAYVKAGTLNWVRLDFTGGGSKGYFDLQNGVVGSVTGSPIDSAIEDAGNGWYRCSITTTSVGSGVGIVPAESDGSISGTSGNIYIQDAQLEQGLVARDYIETTTAAVEGGITDNVPRLDYTDSSCPALLLEPQRTNVATHSEYFGAWNTKGTASVSDNQAVSPEGVQNAALLDFGSTTLGANRIDLQPSISSGTDYVFSVFVKNIDANRIGIRNYNSTKDAIANFDFSSGSFTDTNVNVIDTIVEPYDNDWYRIGIVFNSGVDTTADMRISPDTTSGSDGEQVYIYGAQLEAGTYATSYIPTYGTSVSRAFEPLTLFDFQDNNLTTATSGTLMIHLLDYSENAIQFGFENNSDDSGFRLRFRDSDVIIYERIGSSNTEITAVNESTKSKKVALAWNGTNLLVSVNGTTTSHTITSSAADGNNLKRLNSGSVYALVNKILAFPTQLTEAELNDLTTI
jgi:hypothetical protein